MKFARLPIAAVQDRALSHSAFRVLAAIATYIDRANKCFPSHKAIASRAGFSRRRVIQLINELKDLGHLRVTATRRRNGGKGTNVYDVIFDASQSNSDGPSDATAMSSAPPLPDHRIESPDGSQIANARYVKGHVTSTESSAMCTPTSLRMRNNGAQLEQTQFNKIPADARARARPDADATQCSAVVIALTEAVAAAVDIDLTTNVNWADLRRFVGHWLDIGLPADLIERTSIALGKRRKRFGQKPPSSPRYLEPIMFQALEDRGNPLRRPNGNWFDRLSGSPRLASFAYHPDVVREAHRRIYEGAVKMGIIAGTASTDKDDNWAGDFNDDKLST